MPRPRRSESFYIKLSPQMSQVISLATKASISRPSPTACCTSFPPVAPLKVELRIAVEDTTVDTDDEAEEIQAAAATASTKVRRSLTAPAPAVITRLAPNPYAKYLPKRPSPLRRITNKPLCGSALYSSQSALLPLFTHTNNTDATSDRLFFPRSHPRTPLLKQALRRSFYTGPSGASAKKFGIRGAWEVEKDIQRAIEGGYVGLVMEEFDLQVSPTRTSFKSAVAASPKARQNSESTNKVDSDSEEDSSDEEGNSSGSDGSEDLGPSGFYESSESESEDDDDNENIDVSWEEVILSPI